MNIDPSKRYRIELRTYNIGATPGRTLGIG